MVDALDTVTNNYRITFDRPGIGTHSIPDYEVLVRNNPTDNIQRLKSGSLLEHNPFFPKIIVCCDYFYLKTSKCYLIIFLSGEFVRLHFLFFRFQCSFIKDIKKKEIQKGFYLIIEYFPIHQSVEPQETIPLSAFQQKHRPRQPTMFSPPKFVPSLGSPNPELVSHSDWQKKPISMFSYLAFNNV